MLFVVTKIYSNKNKNCNLGNNVKSREKMIDEFVDERMPILYVLLGPLIKRSGKVVHIRSLVQPYKEALRFGYGHTTDGNAHMRSLSYDRQTRMVNYL